ncbi:MAG: ribose-5-phosphate isomerase RpiA [Anaerolineales bacterium]|jgi:ribose 5-phosphate isomerase A
MKENKTDIDELKHAAAQRALEYVQSGMRLGIGTGTTTAHFIKLLGERIRAGELEDVLGVPTSKETVQLAQTAGVPLTTLTELMGASGLPVLDLVVDGADEVDPHLNLIKGLGKALLREKIIESHTPRFIAIVDETKLSDRLGRGPLPLEIVQFEAQVHVRWLQSLDCRAELWLRENGQPYITDNGNYLARCWFEEGIQDAYGLAKRLAERPGIVEHGLFLDMVDQVIVAAESGVRVIERDGR